MSKFDIFYVLFKDIVTHYAWKFDKLILCKKNQLTFTIEDIENKNMVATNFADILQWGTIASSFV